MLLWIEKFLKEKYLGWYKVIYDLHKKIDRREVSELKGVSLTEWQQKANEFMKAMIEIVEKIVDNKHYQR